MAIDVGAAAIDRASSWNAGTYTSVAKANSANADGTIDTVEIWALSSNLLNCEVATFLIVSGNNLSTRDSELLGTVTAGSKQTFTGLSMDVITADYIGAYYTGFGMLEATDSTGSGILYTSVDSIPCTNSAFTLYSGTDMSLYGTGLEAGGGGWVNIAKVDDVAEASIASVGGVAKASIAKVNGIAV